MSKLLIKTADSMERVARRLKKRGSRSTIVNTTTIADCEAAGWENVEPVFVLSTGRAGTKLLTELINHHAGANAHHTPQPELVRVSARAWKEDAANPEMFNEVLKTSREELIVADARKGNTFVETNNRVTFFAPAAKRIFPKARFILLTRHPAAFVRSGMRRNWYGANHAHDIGRITMQDTGAWERLSQLEKIAWLWEETNRFCFDALAAVPNDRKIIMQAEELFTSVDAATRLLEFCNVDTIDAKFVASRISEPVNAQVFGEFPEWESWSDDDKNALTNIVSVNDACGYSLA